MKYKNIDVILAQKLNTLTPEYRNMYKERVIDSDGYEFNSELMIKIVRSFITKNKLIESDQLPDPIIDIMKNFMVRKLEETSINDINNLFAAFELYGYFFAVIGRLDLMDAPVDLDGYHDQTTYLVDNYTDNDTKILGFYSGYSKDYEEKDTPHAFDYLPIFGLSDQDMKIFDLENSKFTYDLLSKRNELSKFDDTPFRAYVAAQRMRFLVFYNDSQINQDS